ncbi:MAG: hypothetical protein FWB85_06665, partial [Chitinispirillia bacterium]|nr:hypothetical protein [Chitinispirillia bacterium]MCL2241905.1 hypothetical protein [Chitinispirillia bacterium]
MPITASGPRGFGMNAPIYSPSGQGIKWLYSRNNGKYGFIFDCDFKRRWDYVLSVHCAVVIPYTGEKRPLA